MSENFSYLFYGLSKKYFDGDLKPFGGIFRTLD
jgi:hypothetical protein